MKRRVLVYVAVLSTFALAGDVAAQGVEQRVAKLEQDVAAHADRVQQLERFSAATSEQISQVLIGLTTQSQQIATLAGHVAAIGNEVNGLSGQMASVKERIGALAQNVADLKSQVEAHQQDFIELLARVDGIETRVAALEAGPPAGEPRTTKVNCDAGDSLAAAIAALKPGGNTVLVSGACQEGVAFTAMDDLSLIAENGASVPSIAMKSSVRVRVQGFTIRGQTAGPAIGARSSVVELVDNTVEDVTEGIVLVSSTAYLSNNKVLRASLTGVGVSESSTVHIQGLLVLQGMQDKGSTSGTGLVVSGGSRVRVDGILPGSVIYDFPNGMRMGENSSASLLPGDNATPLLTIRSNRTGVIVNASTLNVVGNLLLHNNATSVTASDGATVQLSTGVAFGAGSPFGIRVTNNTTLRVGPRVSFVPHGTAVQLGLRSTVQFGSQVTFEGSTSHLTCDASSVAAGVGLTNATAISCPNVLN